MGYDDHSTNLQIIPMNNSEVPQNSERTDLSWQTKLKYFGISVALLTLSGVIKNSNVNNSIKP